MILAIDVHYKETYAKAVGVLFDLKDEEPKEIITTTINEVEEYQCGHFYKRELPCILQLLKQIDLEKVECIVVDGHVYINNDKTLGLGGHLYQKLEEKNPIIGVAKKSFINTNEVSFPILRGKSKVPLYISAIGYKIEKAIQNIGNMNDNYRMPTILKYLDTLTKEK